MDYPGKVITKTQVTPTQTSASGNWTLDDQAAAIKNNNWPVALVPNPISKSLRFNSADSAYLGRTPSVAGNRKTWTWSGWVKRSAITPASSNFFFFAGASGASSDTTYFGLYFSTSDALAVTGYSQVWRLTTQVFRDPSAWYHIVVAFDTTQATGSNRVKVYLNGSQITAFSSSTDPTLNTDYSVNSTVGHSISGRNPFAASTYFDGYLTEVNFIDGQALTPSSFGMTNPQTGQWIPLKYSGTYGTNGFYLNFKDATSTTTLGYDYSGNANNWTTNNFSVTAGVGNDSLTDVPTPWVAYNTVDSGGVVRGNYCTLNPLVTRGASTTFSNGNLTYTNTSGSADQYVFEGWSTITSQYYECTATTVAASSQYIYAGDNAGYYCSNGQIYINGSLATTVATYTSGDVLGFAITVGGIIRFYKNGTLVYTSSGVAAGTPLCNGFSSTVWNFNFGQRAFNSTPPAGYKSLCTTNLPATAIGFGLTNQGGNYFNIALWNGNGATSRAITGLGYAPNFVWIKKRTSGGTVNRDHVLYDIIRGTGANLRSNQINAESTGNTDELQSFDSDGFTLGSGDNVNGATGTPPYVGWSWKAGGTGVTNTAGTITSTVSANTTAGLSIVTWTGTGSNATVGHGLGVAPSMIIFKRRNSTSNWAVYHKDLTSAAYSIYLDLTNAQALYAPDFNSTAPTSSVISIGTSNNTNTSGGTYVAYCFAAVPGYSAFGSYTGNGSSDGPFAYLGFRPRYVLIKGSSFVSNWFVIDTSRSPYNVSLDALRPNLSGAEVNSPTTTYSIDILSNGFKLRTSAADSNTNAATFIYACFAESPFQFANAR